MKKACQEVEYWLDRGNTAVPINLPVYEHQFLHPEFISNVEKVITEHPNAITYIEFVISEEVITLDRTLALTHFIKLYRINIATALIQHSNGLLPTGFYQKAKIRTLHLDSHLIHEAESSEMSETLLEGIISLDQSLNLISCAPGVNNVQQQIKLNRMGCNKISGDFSLNH